jgi:catechol 2,3-dioxygenase-like lactoylglutathione lyase family enzyme
MPRSAASLLVLNSGTVPTAIHHAVVIVRDLDASLRFYRDGLGLDRLQDRQVEGDWPGLFDAPSRSLRAVFLGDPQVPDDHAGVLELNVLDGDVPAGPPPSPPRTGFFLLSFFVDVEATLSRLAALDLGGPPRRIDQPGPDGPITIATVRDPDGLRVLLTPGSITRSAQRTGQLAAPARAAMATRPLTRGSGTW